MELKQIYTSDTELYPFTERLLTESFPQNEYRDLSDFRQYTDSNALFHNNLIFEKDKRLGFITYWDFPRFAYIEHFAIDKQIQGKGYGAFSLYLLKKVITKPLVLEVELPINNLAVRRIKFYKRQGFKLWNNYYEQPPYRPTDNPYPMLLMVYGDLQSTTDFQEVRSTIYREVYGV
jgi:ribosomal protein S18 acetylase RimI-like enzyme